MNRNSEPLNDDGAPGENAPEPEENASNSPSSTEEINYDEDTWDVIKSYFDINRNYLTNIILVV